MKGPLLFPAVALLLAACGGEKAPAPTEPSVQRGIERSVADVRAAEAAAAAPVERSLTIAEATTKADTGDEAGENSRGTSAGAEKQAG